MDDNNKVPQPTKTCLVIMPFSDPAGYDSGHFKCVYNFLIAPACEKAGFLPKRVDENAKTSVIMIEILNMIVESDMAVCDLSSRNPNVFYELGLRQAFDKKCVLIKDLKTPWPFDVQMLRTLEYDERLRADIVDELVPKLSQAIRETFDNKEKDGNSLVQLLSVKRPAKMPESKEINSDLGIVLNAIESLSSRLQLRNSWQGFFRRELPNGDIVSRGDDLYIKREGSENDYLGFVRSIKNNEIIIHQPDGASIRFSFNDMDNWPNITKQRYNSNEE